MPGEGSLASLFAESARPVGLASHGDVRSRALSITISWKRQFIREIMRGPKLGVFYEASIHNADAMAGLGLGIGS